MIKHFKRTEEDFFCIINNNNNNKPLRIQPMDGIA